MIWWQWILAVWGIKQIFKSKEVKKMLKKGLLGALYWAEAALRSEHVNFKWEMSKFQPGFDVLEEATDDDVLTDEELGEAIGVFGEPMPMPVKYAFWSAEGYLKSRMIDFEWKIEDYQPVFDQMEVMREDNFFEDEELANFLKALREALAKTL